MATQSFMPLAKKSSGSGCFARGMKLRVAIYVQDLIQLYQSTHNNYFKCVKGVQSMSSYTVFLSMYSMIGQ